MFERFTKSARLAVVVAQEEARECRSPQIDVEHVLLGVLAQAETQLLSLLAEEGVTHDGVWHTLSERRKGGPLGEEDAEALRSIGIDLDAVRESLEVAFGEDALDRAVPEERRGPFGWDRGGNFGHIPVSRDAKKALELALREALARKDNHIEPAHLLLGILRVPNQSISRVFGGSRAIHELRPKVHALLDRAA